MLRGHVIALDTHCAFTISAVLDGHGRLLGQRRLATAIPELRELIEGVRRPRHVVLEEGPLADWLVRELRPCADTVVACDPRRNAHIAKDGDKDDPIDAHKLAQLYRGGFIAPVHHPDTLERAVFKQFVGLYHDRVRNVVRHGNRTLAQFRRHGIFASQAALLEPARRQALLGQLPARLLREGLELLLADFDAGQEHLLKLRRRLRREAGRYEAIRRFVAVPGVKWIRAATFFAYVDTPCRFASKQALWRYMGIGLARRHSGSAAPQVGVPAGVTVCRPLKNMILGAAKSALGASNPFAARYQEWCHAGVSTRNARRNVARSLAATLWGMYKSGAAYQPAWVGVAHPAAAENWTSTVAG